jgi:putative polyhydroxyalkanoate system protein
VADLHIARKHTLGLAQARKLAFNWAEQVESDLGMQCIYEEGRSADKVTFSRAGVKGELQVTKDMFELDAKLGFLLGAFKDRIETEITDMLNKLLSAENVAPQVVAKKTAAKKTAAKP